MCSWRCFEGSCSENFVIFCDESDEVYGKGSTVGTIVIFLNEVLHQIIS